MQKTCLIVPCYNEEKRLKSKIFISFLEENPNIHFLFVNDGSSDKTVEILEKIKEKSAQVDLISLRQNSGKGEAVRQGLLQAAKNQFDLVGFIDADLSSPLEEIPRLVSFFNNEILFVSGSRIKKVGATINRKLHRHILGRIFATIVGFTLKLNIYDTQCGLKIFKTFLINPIFSEPFSSKWIFDVEIFYRFSKIIHNKNLNEKAVEVPLNKWEDVSGSKLKVFDFIKVPFELLIFFLKKN